MRSFIPLRSSFALALLLISSDLKAQQREPEQMEEVVVQGAVPITGIVGESVLVPVRKPEAGSPTEKGVIAAKERLSKVPGSTDVVPIEEYEATYAQSMKELFTYVPGVFAEQRYAEEVRLSIRGSGIGRSFHLRGIDILQDGIPYNLADASGDFQEIDPLATRYTEVYRGSQAFELGSSSIGGAINFVSPTGRTLPSKGSIRVDGGSFDTLRVHADAGHAWEGGDIFISTTGISAEGFREQSEQGAGRLSGNAAVKIGDKSESRFYFSLNNINQDVPGALSLNDALYNRRTSYDINRTNRYQRDVESARFASKTTAHIADGIESEFGGYYFQKHLYHPIFQVLDQDYVNFGLFKRTTFDHSIGTVDARLKTGVNYRRGTTIAKQFINVEGRRGIKTGDSEQEATYFDLFLEEEVELGGGVTLVGGGRYLYSERDFTNRLTPENSDSIDYHRVAPRVGAMWEYAPAQQLFAGVTRGYEPPTYAELVQFPIVGFVPLDLQRAWTLDLGARGSAGGVSWDATLYRSWVSGELLNYTVDQNVPASTFNAGDTIHQGVELGFDVDLTRVTKMTDSPVQVGWRVSYTLNDFSFDGDSQYGNRTLPGIPPHVFNTALSFRHSSGVSVTPTLQYVPDGAYLDYKNTARVPSYTIWGVQGSYDVNDRVVLFVEGRNLNDERYISNFGPVTDLTTAPTANVFYPGQPRSVFGGITVRF